VLCQMIGKRNGSFLAHPLVAQTYAIAIAIAIDKFLAQRQGGMSEHSRNALNALLFQVRSLLL
jgi:hypothetical protein